MKCLLLPLLAAIALPTAVFAELIPKISDYEFEYKEGEKIEFRCPRKRERDKKTKKYIFTKLYENCWFQLNDDHINIMDRQKINREDIISYWEINDTNGGATWIGKHYINYIINGEFKRVEFQTKNKFWTANWWKEHGKLKEAITIWMSKGK